MKQVLQLTNKREKCYFKLRSAISTNDAAYNRDTLKLWLCVIVQVQLCDSAYWCLVLSQ